MMFGQTYMDKVSKETCECINKKNIDLKSSDVDKLQVELGLCIMQSYTKFSNEFPKNKRLDFSDSKQMETFGMEVGMKMIKDCPDIILTLGKSYRKNTLNDESEDDLVLDSTTVNTEEPDDDITITGVYQGSKTDGFYYITVKESSGKINQMALINNFENSFLILDQVLKQNDKVQVSYFDAELFDVKLNRFVTVKVISDIKKL
ncbi:hypothetical protein RF683_04955 [Flavobacterium sp. 20NA77.7]|uniref:Uncharacterized protein n=1 Tax=Flavobacterium nakdongensis TaxID=3073563 RepID=A0ABY9RDS4_9FLAO|nr:hypothetical protein [Flavobacterium sp. 20NA77.7]WMW78795.1 hypothetical protein RF683_04955 [Flavobacterium sp. 20NA77.7]